MEKIGFIGLGKMGLPMSRRILESKSYELFVYNRTPGKELDAQVVANPAELASEVDRLVVMVSDDEACEVVLFGENGVASSDARPLVINMSTISPKTSMDFEKRMEEMGFGYVEAPVLGSVGPATQGTLVVLAAGKEVERARDLFDIFGRVTYEFPQVGKAAEVKLLINTNLGVQMAILAETLSAAEKLGIPPERFMEVVNDSAVKTVVSQFKKDNLLKDEFPAAFPYRHLLKDLRYSVGMSSDAGARVDLASATRDIYAGSEELFDLDFSAVKRAYGT